jgi:hypothetical protein
VSRATRYPVSQPSRHVYPTTAQHSIFRCLS